MQTRLLRTWWWGIDRALSNFLEEAFIRLNERNDMTQKFSKGDTISIEAKVAYANSDGSLNLDLPNGRPCVAFEKEHLKSAQLVKKAVPTRPKAGTIITHYDTKYIVTTDDNLTYVDSYAGDTFPKYNLWSDLDHDNVKILG